LGIQVVFTSRDPSKGQAAAGKLHEEGLPVVYHPLDVTRFESIEHLAQFVRC
jgi:NAD(P)-dependent dehydrogenase (short-subunit alcohol dehydrogenase family)